jgi:hypothetical protein
MQQSKLICALILILLVFSPIHAQTDRGTLTGVVLDPTGAVIRNASITATNLANGAVLRTATTETGAYTFPSLAWGDYSLVVDSPGFKQFSRSPIHIDVAQTLRLDVSMDMGAASESVTVSAEATMLQVTSEYNLSMSGRQMEDLPLNFAGGPGAIRSPYGFLELMPGASNSNLDVEQPSGFGIDIRVNGMPNNSFKALVDGQDATNPMRAQLAEEMQPSNEAIQAFTLQSSNYAAEFGRAGGGVINFTTKSGANRFHGSAYDHMRHESLGAGLPWSDDGGGHHVRGRDRQQDYGFSLGGPVIIPKLYQGRDKTFFYFNWEQYRRVEQRYSGLVNVPTDAFREGDFSSMLTGRRLTTDNRGRAVMEGTVYDPSTNRTEAGVATRDPFPENRFPKSRMDPVSLKLQNLIPTPLIASSQPINNYYSYTRVQKIMSIPSIKIDHMIGPARLSFYYSPQSTDKDNAPNGLPLPISNMRTQQIEGKTARLNYDHTLSASLFNHMGFGIVRYVNPDQHSSKDFDATSVLGLQGALRPGMPIVNITNLAATERVPAMGAGINTFLVTKPTAVESLTWVRGNHIYKFGGEWALENTVRLQEQGGIGTYNFAAAQTSYPVSMGLSGGYIGNGYASFLLGDANTGVMGPYGGIAYRRHVWGFFAQDTWKITRKITLDYGLRYDYQPIQREMHRRTASFDPNLANPKVGGLPGALVYEGYGSGRCNCDFSSPYPWAFGPRLGLAWQAQPKTVVRAGFGINYGRGNNQQLTAANAAGFGFNTLNFAGAGTGQAAFSFSDGMPYNVADLFANDLNPGLRPLNAAAAPAAASVPWMDRNGGRPPRIMQWNISIQRELSRDMVAQAAYVGNRAVWLENNSMTDLNALTPERLASFGLDVDVAADRSLLTSQIGSATAINRGFKKPYSTFPNNSTVAQSLRPYPQFTTITSMGSPLGSSWYDALQLNLVKRMSHGVNASVAYTWSKNLANTYSEQADSIFINDPFNRANAKSIAPQDQPHVLAIGFGYTAPSFGAVRSNRILKTALGGWSLRGVLRYASGLPIATPVAQNNLNAVLFRSTLANRVPGEPLFLTDLNCRDCFDPASTLVYNPAAWQDPLPGHYGDSSPYYSDYRYQRRPKESLSIAKTMTVKERYRLDLRAEFFNIFNRAVVPNPVGTNAKETARYDPVSGVPTQGFGRIDVSTASVATPRTGQIVIRFSF